MQGAVYRDAASKEFVVKLAEHTSAESWVYYQAVGTGLEYSCLIGAFNERFTKIENSR